MADYNNSGEDPKRKGTFDKDAFKRGIAYTESRNFKNPYEAIPVDKKGNLLSSASGKYQFLYNEIKDLPQMRGISKEEFLKNPELQEMIMDLAIEGKLPNRPGYYKNANDLTNSYAPLYGENWRYRPDEVAALTHYLGRKGARDYMRAQLEGKDYTVAGKTNMDVEDYLRTYNVGAGMEYIPRAESQTAQQPQDPYEGRMSLTSGASYQQDPRIMRNMQSIDSMNPNNYRQDVQLPNNMGRGEFPTYIPPSGGMTSIEEPIGNYPNDPRPQSQLSMPESQATKPQAQLTGTEFIQQYIQTNQDKFVNGGYVNRFENGGRIDPKKKKSERGQATRQDSLNVRNSSIAVENYYKNNNYRDITKQVDLDKKALAELKIHHNQTISNAKKAIKDLETNGYSNKDERVKVYQSWINNSKKQLKNIENSITSDDPINYINSLNAGNNRNIQRHSNNQLGRYINANGEIINSPLPNSEYRKVLNENQFTQRDISDGFIDTRAPETLYDRRITPHEFKKYGNPEGKPQDHVEIFKYDELATTPSDMLSNQEKALRISRFGRDGIPNSFMPNLKKGDKISDRFITPVSELSSINIPNNFNKPIVNTEGLKAPTQKIPYNISEQRIPGTNIIRRDGVFREMQTREEYRKTNLRPNGKPYPEALMNGGPIQNFYQDGGEIDPPRKKLSKSQQGVNIRYKDLDEEKIVNSTSPEYRELYGNLYPIVDGDVYMELDPVTINPQKKQWEIDRDTIEVGKGRPWNTINWKKWGLNDYSDFTSFNSAFRNAREAGKDKFIYKDERYNTKLIGKEQSNLYWESKNFLEDYYNNNQYKPKRELTPYDSIQVQMDNTEDKYIKENISQDRIEEIRSIQREIDELENKDTLTYSEIIKLNESYNKMEQSGIQIFNDGNYHIDGEKTGYNKFLKTKYDEALRIKNSNKKELDRLNSKDYYFSITDHKPKDMSSDGYINRGKKKMFLTTNAEPDKLNTTYIHELSHKSDDIIDVSNRVPTINIDGINASRGSYPLSQSQFDYISDPSEIEARKMSLLFYGHKNNIDFSKMSSKEFENFYHSNKNKLPYDIVQLFDLYSFQKEDLLKYIKNDFSYLKNNNQNQKVYGGYTNTIQPLNLKFNNKMADGGPVNNTIDPDPPTKDPLTDNLIKRIQENNKIGPRHETGKFEHIKKFNYKEDLGFFTRNAAKIIAGDEKLQKLQGIYNQLVDYKNKRPEGAPMSSEEKQLRENIIKAQNFGYPSGLKQLNAFADRVLEGKEQPKWLSPYRPNWERMRDALNRKYFGLDYDERLLEESKYKPSNSENPNASYIDFYEPARKKTIKNLRDVYPTFEDLHQRFRNGSQVVTYTGLIGNRSIRNDDNASALSQLNNFTMGSGEDEKGRYISYYDKWDIKLPGLEEVDIDELNNPYEIYGRIYEKEYNIDNKSIDQKKEDFKKALGEK